MLVVEHGAVGVTQFLHDSTLVDIGTGEFLTLTTVGAVVGQGAVDVAVAGGGDVALVARLGDEQVMVRPVALGGKAVRRERLDKCEGAIGRRGQQAVGSSEPRVITHLTTTPRDHRHEPHHHNQYDHRQMLHRTAKINKNCELY
ncbi:MAG: hypothetical protein IJS04_02780 [Muribaculaceae bacterium]|nr:hypothetical protein [Muribaculaceae bacterium]MBQ7204746.1 hypothetical protein [Muribaculaceae bacterium]